MKKTTVRVRGMNAAATLSAEPAGDRQFPHASLRQLFVAVLILAIGGLVAWYTIGKVSGPPAFVGTVQPARSVNLDFPETGRVTQLLVKPGDHVAQGQALAVQDQTVARANLTDAQAVLAADQAKLAALKAPQVPDTVKQNLDLQVQKANTQVSGAQQASSDAAAKAGAEIKRAQQSVNAAQAALTADSDKYRATCTGDAVPADAGSRCNDLQAQVQQDTAGLGTANADLSHAEATATQAQDSAANSLASARASLALAQNQQASAAEPASAADISAAEAEVASAKATVDQDQAALDSLTLTAPMAGTVALLGGIVGELDGSTGVHAFSGPQSLQDGNGPAFTLFPGPAGTNATQTTSTTQQPLISLVTTESTAVAQVGEESVAGLHPGTAAQITINALHQTVEGTLTQLVPVPVGQGDGVAYHVRLSVADWPPGTVPGMSLSVEFR